MAFAGRVTVNLNYTVSSAALKACCETAGLKHVITSRKFMEKVNLGRGCTLVYLEDLKDKISLWRQDLRSAQCEAEISFRFASHVGFPWQTDR